MKYVLLVAVAVSSLGLVACSESPAVGDAARLVTPGPVVTAHPEGYTQPRTREARLDAFEARSAFRVGLREIMAGAEGWRDADARTRELLRRSTEVPRYVSEQTAASYMLSEFLLRGDRDKPEPQVEAIEFYVEMLVRHGNPNASLIDRALAELEGHWSLESIARSAEIAYRAAEKYARVRTNCDDCEISEMKGASARSLTPTMSGALQDAIDGAERLKPRFLKLDESDPRVRAG